MRGGRIQFLFTLAALSAGVACSSSKGSHGGKPDGGEASGGAAASSGGANAGGAFAGAGGAGGASTGGAGAGGDVVCGGETCTTSSEGTGVQARPCCTDDDACGVRIPLSTRCLPRNQFGTTNAHCSSYDIPNFTLPGCCRTDGCGVRITFENLGCISNGDLSRSSVPCNQDGTPAGDGG